MYLFSSNSTDSALFTTDHIAATKNQYLFEEVYEVYRYIK
jgi:hypothetical protein